jgi:DNA (cytosine-5)-methyltransferase 1
MKKLKNQMQTLKIITLCSGYDSQCLALERLKRDFPGFDYELIAWAEYDPESKTPLDKQPAVVAHNALFPQWEDRNLGDMTKINWVGQNLQCDLLFYSTPCQSISQAGLQHGFEEGSGTRSSIIWNVRDAVIALKPKYLCLENVKAMVSGKFVGMFNLWQLELERLGYRNFAQVLNAKDYGVPQNRERIFLVSIRVDDENNLPKYYFPNPFTLDLRLKDVLEDNVDEKYYLSDKMLDYFNRVDADKTHGHNFTPKDGDDTAFTIRTAPGNRVDDNFIKEDEQDE